MHRDQPRNLPDGVELTDHTRDVREIALEKLVPPIKAVEVEVDGVIRFVGAGTRVAVPLLSSAANSNLDLDDDIGDGMGCQYVMMLEDGSLNDGPRISEQADDQTQIQMKTPFRLVTMDKEGRIMVDMNWVQDVMPLEGSAAIEDTMEDDQGKHIGIDGG